MQPLGREAVALQDLARVLGVDDDLLKAAGQRRQHVQPVLAKVLQMGILPGKEARRADAVVVHKLEVGAIERLLHVVGPDGVVEPQQVVARRPIQP